MATEWRKTTLGSLLLFSNGKTSPFRSDQFLHPVYGSNGIIGFSEETNAEPNTIVIGRVGSYCGSLRYSESSCWVTDNAIQANTAIGNDPRFLYYLLQVLQLNDWRSGSGQPLLNQTILAGIEARVPPLPQQRTIAHVLGTLDDKIELNRRMNETLEAMARAIFQDWFVDFGPVRTKLEGKEPYLSPELWSLFPDRLVDSELGEIPDGWEVGRIGDLASQRRQGIRPEQIEPNTPYIALEHMPRRCIALSVWEEAEGLASGKFEFKQRDILFGKLRPYFHKVGIAPLEGVCSTDIVVVSPKSEEWFGVTLGHMSSMEFVDYTHATSTGTRMPRTNWAVMASYKVALPGADLANTFTGLMLQWVDKIISAIHECHTLVVQRDSLLPKLVSGEVLAGSSEVQEADDQ